METDQEAEGYAELADEAKEFAELTLPAFNETQEKIFDDQTVDPLEHIRANYTPADVAQAARELIAQLIEEAKLHPSTASGKTVIQLKGDEADYDKTQLSMIQGKNLMRIHRDYIAHAVRYEFLIQRIKNAWQDAMILDIGCADVPLLRAIRSSMLRPKLYYGLDVRAGEIQKVLRYYSSHNVHFPWQAIYGDFTEAGPDVLDQPWTHVVCLEVLEHMPKGRGQKLLGNIRKSLSGGGEGYISTPCFDGSRKAGHHKYEWTHDELRDEYKNQGLEVMAHWGTFSNVRHLYRVLTPEEKATWDGLDQRNGGYYGNIALSLIFSPLHPEVARNAIWQVKHDGS